MFYYNLLAGEIYFIQKKNIYRIEIIMSEMKGKKNLFLYIYVFAIDKKQQQ